MMTSGFIFFGGRKKKEKKKMKTCILGWGNIKKEK